MQKSDILEKAKKLLSEVDIKVSDFALEFYYDDIEEQILAYCNLDNIYENYETLDKLGNFIIKMIINECQKAVLSNDESVSSISEGGRSVSFVNKLELVKEFDGNAKKILNKFKVLYK